MNTERTNRIPRVVAGPVDRFGFMVLDALRKMKAWHYRREVARFDLAMDAVRTNLQLDEVLLEDLDKSRRDAQQRLQALQPHQQGEKR